MAITDPEHVATLAAMLGVTQKKCRRALAAALARSPGDVAAQIRHVALLCVTDGDKRAAVLAQLGVLETEPEPEEPAVVTRKTPPKMPPNLLKDIPERNWEKALSEREEWFNLKDEDLHWQAKRRGFPDVSDLERIQIVDLIVWLDWCDSRKITKAMEEEE